MYIFNIQQKNIIIIVLQQNTITLKGSNTYIVYVYIHIMGLYISFEYHVFFEWIMIMDQAPPI